MPVVLFDLMDTLVREPYHTAVTHLFPNSLHKTEFFQWKNRENFHSFERGEISEREHFQNFYLKTTPSDVLEHLPKPSKVKKILFRNLYYLSGMQELLKKLQNNHQVITGIASNYSQWHTIFLERLPLLSNCNFLFFSCEIGHRKPESAYYTTITKALHTAKAIKNTNEILFLDDRQMNLEGAQKSGWQTHLMQNSHDASCAIDKFLKI